MTVYLGTTIFSSEEMLSLIKLGKG